MTTVLLLLFLVLIIIFWYESLKVREHMIELCRQVCERCDLQFLDQSVAMVSVSIKKGTDNIPHLYRYYKFEVSDNGVNRYPGYVVLFGHEIISISYQGEEGENIIYQADTRTLH